MRDELYMQGVIGEKSIEYATIVHNADFQFVHGAWPFSLQNEKEKNTCKRALVPIVRLSNWVTSVVTVCAFFSL